jgi:DNA-binding NarL/FixJ family response regulator
MMRICVVDDHEVVREGLRAALETSGGDVRVVAEAASAFDALDLIVATRPDVVITDYRLPDLAGDELCRRILDRHPDLKVVVLTTFLNEEVVRSCYEAGAAAFVTKAAGLGELRQILSRLANGMRPGTESVSATVERLFRHSERAALLTPRQEAVLVLASEGLTYNKIAKQLAIAESTVRFHIQSLKARFGARSKTELIGIALSRALIPPPHCATPRPSDLDTS